MFKLVQAVVFTCSSGQWLGTFWVVLHQVLPFSSVVAIFVTLLNLYCLSFGSIPCGITKENACFDISG